MSDSFVTPWTVVCQAALSWDFLGKNTGVGCHFLLQGIFLTKRLNLHLLQLLHHQADSHHRATWEDQSAIPQYKIKSPKEKKNS